MIVMALMRRVVTEVAQGPRREGDGGLDVAKSACRMRSSGIIQKHADGYYKLTAPRVRRYKGVKNGNRCEIRNGEALCFCLFSARGVGMT
jgi:hypothetical protein